MIERTCRSATEPLIQAVASAAHKGGAALSWLGQAGFAVHIGGVDLLIDPYLSDHLADKYADGPYSHERMMPPPLDAAAIPHLDYVLCTHRHGDHMDPPLLRALALRLPHLRFVVPEAVADHAVDVVGLPAERLCLMDDGRQKMLAPNVQLSGVAAAHETLEQNAYSHHRFLGYVLKSPHACLYHSGDCVPYDGLTTRVRGHAPDLALLPVNGRAETLTADGIAGNFTLDEAIVLCQETAIPSMIAHHHGLFAFNTIDAEVIDTAAERPGMSLDLIRPRLDDIYRITHERAD